MTTEHILAALFTGIVALIAGRRWIDHGRTARRYSARWWVFMTIGRAFDTVAFVFLAAILFFLLMSI